MIRIEKKNIDNKPYYYLTERVAFRGTFKKIQVYIGKTVPKDISRQHELLKKKEKALVQSEQTGYGELVDAQLYKLELARLDWKYFWAQLSEHKKKKALRDFAIQFIFHSNAIEGSRLSNDEVSKIVRNQYISTKTPRDEVQEVYNSLEAFEYIRQDFVLNIKNIKKLYQIITKDLSGYEPGFKTRSNQVNGKNIVVQPHEVRSELQKLISWYKENKKKKNQFLVGVLFHNRFESIHPFLDGNGRTGRMIWIWMLMQSSHGFILINQRNKQKYFSGQDSADEGRPHKLLLFSIDSYRKTARDIIKEHQGK